jgi:hypothetical protein
MIKNPVDTALEKHLDYLKLPYLKENCRPFAAEGNAKHWSHIDYLARLIEGEAAARHDRTILHRIKAARFPLIKTLESFRWDWPKKINQLQIQDLFRLLFIDQKANAIFLDSCLQNYRHNWSNICKQQYYAASRRLTMSWWPCQLYDPDAAGGSPACLGQEGLSENANTGYGASARWIGNQDRQQSSDRELP